MGFLNVTPNDAYNTQALTQGGVTDQLPGASGFDGMLSAAPKALVSAGMSLGSLAEDALKDSQVGDAVNAITSSVDTANKALAPTFGYNPITPAIDADSRASANAAADVVSKWADTGEDPRVTGTLGRMVFGPVKALTILAGAAPVVGPWGAAALFGATGAHDTYSQSIAAGLDPTTAAEQAAVTGVADTAGALIPGAGSTLASRLAISVAANDTLDVAGRAASYEVLSHNGYQAQADQVKIIDGQSLLADTIMSLAFGAHAHYEAGGFSRADAAHVNPADVDTSAAVLTQNHIDQSSTGIPTDPGVANLHVDTLTSAIDSMSKGEDIKVSADDAQKLAEGTLPDPGHDMLDSIVSAAHENIPQYADAVDNIPEITPPAREPQEPLGQIPPDATGKEAPAQFDDMTQQRLDTLTSKYGDLQITNEDGKTQSVSDVAQEMQNQMADADAMGKAHEAAAACFISTGGDA